MTAQLGGTRKATDGALAELVARLGETGRKDGLKSPPWRISRLRNLSVYLLKKFNKVVKCYNFFIILQYETKDSDIRRIF